MTARLALSVVVAVAGVATVTVKHRRHTPTLAVTSALPSASDRLAERVSRSRERESLLPVKRDSTHVHPSRTAKTHPIRRATPAGEQRLSDVTMYCATGNRNAAGYWPQVGDVAVMDRSIPFGTRVTIDGNVYTVRDWIGSGSDFDIYGGSDAGCEQRALNYGRRHLRVVIG